ncbi:MAG: hypothetical protein AAGJ93_04600 [Bacteroidota bacterium]
MDFSNSPKNTYNPRDTLSSEWIRIPCVWYNKSLRFENNLITNNQQYQEIAPYQNPDQLPIPGCDGLPKIDFDKYSLVVCKTIYGGCPEEIVVKTEFLQIEDNQYKLKFSILKNSCRALLTHFFLIKVPKLLPTAKVEIVDLNNEPLRKR